MFLWIRISSYTPNFKRRERWININAPGNPWVRCLTWTTVERAWQVKQRYRLAYWDSLIVSSTLEAECAVLYSEDLQHQQIIEGALRIINPLLQ